MEDEVNKLTIELSNKLCEETANFMDKYRLKNEVMLLATQHAILIYMTSATKLLSSMKNDKISRIKYVDTVKKGIDALFNQIKNDLYYE